MGKLEKQEEEEGNQLDHHYSIYLGMCFSMWQRNHIL
jgi:hypothetical protein